MWQIATHRKPAGAMSHFPETIETEDDLAAGLAQLRAQDRRLERVVAQAGAVPLRRTEPGFASLADIIVAQQVSKQSAAAISGRMRKIIDPLTPECFMAAGVPGWRQVGLSRPKQRTLAAVCQAIAADRLDLDRICALDADMAIATMTAVRGIGPWTAEVYLLFAAGHRDIFPAGDLALRAAAAAAFDLDHRPDEEALRQMAESWAPWRGVAARLLWAYYAKAVGRAAAP